MQFTAPQQLDSRKPLIADGNQNLREEIDRLLDISRSTMPVSPEMNGGELQERLFDARAHFKVTLSEVSMHLGRDWVFGLFKQIDNLLDFDEWDEDDPTPQQSSSLTLIRLLLILNSRKRPGIGISNRGTLIAAWTEGKNRLTIECKLNDQISWVLTRVFAEQTERAAGDCAIERVLDVLRPYSPEIWFDNA